MELADDIHLAEDVFFCVAQGHGIFLDLSRDTYSAVLLPAGDVGGEGQGIDISKALRPHREALIGAGLVVQGSRGRTLALAPGNPSVGEHLQGAYGGRLFGIQRGGESKARATPLAVCAFMFASWKTARRLKRWHISRTVRIVRKRKAGAPSDPVAPERLKDLLDVFRKLRPWYPHDYACLFEALALAEFLAFYRIYPTWVFGVQAQPFGAHCWLEADGLLLNESLEYAGQFTAIMRV
jgi:hypothetical protein